MTTLAAALAALALAAVAATTRAPDPTPATDAVDRLSLRELAGQRIIVGYGGGDLPAALRARVRAGAVGGVIVFDRNIPSRRHLRAELRRLQRTARPLEAPLLTMVDQEGGQVKRLSGPPSVSPARMGARGTAYTGAQGRATAANLRAVALNVNLAPVADLGLPGSYQRATGRAFGDRAAPVSAAVRAFATGLQAGGVAATLKHFPGLGRVSGDEDARVQTVRASAGTLRHQDEAPFRAGIRGGVRLVMTSTARYPALDRGPALLSPAITTGELRGRLGFGGVVITDDLDVPALRPYGRAGRLAIDATRAGNDLLLYCQSAANADRALDATVRAVGGGRITREQLEASVRRILALRTALP